MGIFERGTLRGRSALRAFLIAVVALELATVVIGLVWRSRTLAAVAEGLTTHIRSVESGLTADMLTGAAPPAAVEAALLAAPEAGVQLVAPDGAVLQATSGLTGMPALIPVADLAIDTPATTIVTQNGYGHALVEGELTEIDGRVIGIEAIAGLDEVDAALRTTWLIGAGAVVASLLIAVGVSVSVDRALEPVRALTSRAAQIAAGTRPMRLEVTASNAEIRLLAGQLDHLLEVIRAGFDREQAFLDDASHELRTPIAIALAELDLARRAAPDAATTEAVDSALEELRRLDRIAADLLVLARARATGAERFVTVDMGPVAQRAASTVRRDPRQHPVTLAVHGHGSVKGDPDALERALTNVIANAARHCTGEVDVEILPDDGRVTTTISDDGPGFPEHLLPDLFDRFTRGADFQARSTGLGTAIAAEVVRNHDGTITASNRPQGGALVTIDLPAAGDL